MHIKAFWLILIGVFACGCDKGLNPSVPRPAQIPMGQMSGLIRYQHWPPSDSLHDLRLVAFRVFPPTNIVNEVLLGRAIVYPSLGDTALVPFYVDSLRYLFSLPVGEYQYVVIAQQFGPTITTDWRAVGQYDLDSNFAIPSPVTILENDTALNININVDFRNPPPPPFQ
ncbi:MAG: hypothetical protein HW412_2429 [Bacteroidetes bacterium]|nr:hypothetical protein [Bacteroidota bacterium]